MKKRSKPSISNFLQKSIALWCLLLCTTHASAQVGEYRSDLSVGINGGCVLSNVGFIPKVVQKPHMGQTGGLTIKYVCEKYFSTYCSIYGEVNYAVTGWKQNIINDQEKPVINTQTGLPEQYSRTTGYVQVPVFAHLAWGKEQNGLQFFFQVGPQLGYWLNEKAEANYQLDERNIKERANQTIEQESMPIKNKLDYGIATGMGLEYSHRKIGHFLVEGRFYYGLGNIYDATKKDYFAKSNFNNLVFKVTYLLDLIRTPQTKK